METSMTIEKRKNRQIEFCDKLRELIDEYSVALSIYDSHYAPFHMNHLGIVVDAHLQESWDAPLFFENLDSGPLELAIQDLEENGIETGETKCYGEKKVYVLKKCERDDSQM